MRESIIRGASALLPPPAFVRMHACMGKINASHHSLMLGLGGLVWRSRGQGVKRIIPNT